MQQFLVLRVKLQSQNKLIHKNKLLVLRVKLQSQNKLIHKTNETDGEVDKTDAENL